MNNAKEQRGRDFLYKGTNLWMISRSIAICHRWCHLPNLDIQIQLKLRKFLIFIVDIGNSIFRWCTDVFGMAIRLYRRCIDSDDNYCMWKLPSPATFEHQGSIQIPRAVLNIKLKFRVQFDSICLKCDASYFVSVCHLRYLLIEWWDVNCGCKQSDWSFALNLKQLVILSFLDAMWQWRIIYLNYITEANAYYSEQK